MSEATRVEVEFSLNVAMAGYHLVYRDDPRVVYKVVSTNPIKIVKDKWDDRVQRMVGFKSS